MKNIILLLLVCLALAQLSCRKDFLAKSPDRSLLVPLNLKDFQAPLDDNSVMIVSPSLPFISADDFYITDNGYTSLATPVERNCYIWSPNVDIYEGRMIGDWATPYLQIFTTNVVLEGLEGIRGEDRQLQLFSTIKGSALFHRAFAMFNLAQVFAPAYDVNTANTDLGIPIRLEADVNKKVGRSSVFDTYKQILEDLNTAVNLLPITSEYKTRPISGAAHLLLARTYLLMGNYVQASHHAKKTIEQSVGLIDYNTLNSSSVRPFPIALPNSNVEVLFYSSMITYGFLLSPLVGVDINLYAAYVGNDLRRDLFFRDRGNNIFQFKGNYTGATSQFGGLSLAEAYLIDAECVARIGNYSNAFEILGELLKKRWKTGTFLHYTATSREEAIKLILKERRKELVARDTRWSDLKRLNLDPIYEVAISRRLNGSDYSLMPRDKRYALPIPIQEIAITGIPQNPR